MCVTGGRAGGILHLFCMYACLIRETAIATIAAADALSAHFIAYQRCSQFYYFPFYFFIWFDFIWFHLVLPFYSILHFSLCCCWSFLCVCVCVLSWTSALSFRPTTEFSLQSWFHPFFSSMQIDLFSAVICHFTFEWAMSSFLLCNKKFVESFASDNFSIDKSDRSFCFRLHNVFGFCVRLLPSKYESLVYIVIVYQSLISIWPHFTSFSMF